MRIKHILFQDTGRFSQLICDYLNEDDRLQSSYGYYPSIKNLKEQMELKKGLYTKKSRSILVDVLQQQYKNIETDISVKKNLNLLAQQNTFTVTTGHQLCLMTGPLYFIYKIISTINLCKQLKVAFPKSNFVPIYWMASEDHDFEEISSFRFQDKSIRWNREPAGAVGTLPLDDLQSVLDVFETHLGNQPEAHSLKNLIQQSYRNAADLSEATLKFVNMLFSSEGLVVIEPQNKQLKTLFSPIVKEELSSQESFKSVKKQIEILKRDYDSSYKPQVNPREINLFYLGTEGRYRIEQDGEGFKLNGTEKRFSKTELFEILEKHPERFSPNVILRPVYQELLLPNLCYVGGGGEIAYWFQLKANFDRLKIPLPSLLVRNSVLLYNEKQAKKIDKLNLESSDLFLKRNDLINKKIRQISNIDLDLTNLKEQLKEQFEHLQTLVDQTDQSFKGAVNAQEKKQMKGIEHLEKRLLKAQKRLLSDHVGRLVLLHDQLFPNDQLQERSLNFVSFYLEMGTAFVPNLLKSLDPLNPHLTLIKY